MDVGGSAVPGGFGAEPEYFILLDFQVLNVSFAEGEDPIRSFIGELRTKDGGVNSDFVFLWT